MVFTPDFSIEEFYMQQALLEAKAAADVGEVPIGAVVVCKNKIIARAHNLTQTLKDATAHAEIQAITSASGYLGAKYLKNCDLYVTVEPCVMCAGALYWSQLARVIYGAADVKRGFLMTNFDLHLQTELVGGILEEECAALIKDFFKGKR